MKKTSFQFRRAWLNALQGAPTQVFAIVMQAVMNYVFDGIEPTLSDPEAKTAFAFIRADIDEREARKAARKAGRQAKPKAKPAPIPGYLPEKAPDNLMERAKAVPEIRFALENRNLFYEFAKMEEGLFAELALQITDWWREHPSESLPSFKRLREEFDNRFTNFPSTRQAWIRHMAPYMPQACASSKSSA